MNKMKVQLVNLTILLILALQIAAQSGLSQVRQISARAGETVDFRLDENSCVMFLNDEEWTITIFGKTFDSILPAGTAFMVEAGVFKITGRTTTGTELIILPFNDCSSNSYGVSRDKSRSDRRLSPKASSVCQ